MPGVKGLPVKFFPPTVDAADISDPRRVASPGRAALPATTAFPAKTLPLIVTFCHSVPSEKVPSVMNEFAEIGSWEGIS